MTRVRDETLDFRLQVIIISLRQIDSSVVVESGRLFVFGDNSYGQLGLGNSKPQTKPSCVKGMSDIVLYFFWYYFIYYWE